MTSVSLASSGTNDALSDTGTPLASMPAGSKDVSSTDSHDQSGEQFLRFQLIPGMYALMPMAQLAEVLTIPIGRIAPIPELPDWMMGVYNWRSEALWMVDLASLVNLTPWHQHTIRTAYSAVVLLTGLPKALVAHAADQAIGLVITQAEIISRCDPNDFLPSLPSQYNGVVPACLTPYLRGYHVPESSDDCQCLPVLDGERILAEIAKRNAKRK